MLKFVWFGKGNDKDGGSRGNGWGGRPVALGCGNGGIFAEFFIEFGMNGKRMGAEHRFARWCGICRRLSDENSAKIFQIA